MVTEGFPRAYAHSLSRLLTALVAEALPEVDDSVSPAFSNLDPLCAGAFLSCVYAVYH